MSNMALLISDIALAISSAAAAFIMFYTVATLMRLSRDEKQPADQQEA